MAQDVVIKIRMDQNVSKEAGKAAKGGGKLKKVLGGLKTGALAAAAGFAAMTAAVGTAVAAIGKALEAFGEQARVNGLVADSLRRAGLEGKALAKEYERIQGLAGELAGETLFGDEAILEATAKFSQLTGEARVEREQLNLILGIAAKQDKEAADAAELYAKALKGEIGPIKDLTPLTKKQEEALNKVKDESKKAAKVNELLTKSFKGFAQQVDPTQNSIKNLSDAKGDLLQKIGEVISASGAVTVVLDPLTKVLRMVESAINDNSVVIQNFILNGLDAALTSVVQLTGTLIAYSDQIGTLLTVGKVFGRQLIVIQNVFSAVGRVVRGVVLTAITGVIEAFANMIATAELAAEKLGQDGLAARLSEARGEIEKLSTASGALALDQFEGAATDAKDIKAQFEGMVTDIQTTDERAAAFKKTMEGARDMASAARDQTRKMREEVEPIGAAPGTGKGVDPSGETPQVKAAKKEKKEKKELTAIQRQILQLKIAEAKTSGELERATIQHRIALAEIQEQNLQGLEKELALTQANAELNKALSEEGERQRDTEGQREILQLKMQEIAAEDELTQLQIQRQIALAEIRKQNLQGLEREVAIARANEQFKDESHKLEMERTRKEQKAQKNQIQSALSGIQSLSTGNTVADELAKSLGTVALEAKAVGDGLKDANQASQAALQSLGASIVTVADEMGASAAAQAAILSVFQAASAAAAFAVGNIPGGIQHSIASATYAAVAAMSAGGKSKGAATSGGRAAGQSSAMRQRDQARANQDMMGGRTSNESEGDIYIMIDNRGSLNGSAKDPALARNIFDAAAEGGRSKGFDMEQLRRRRRGG